MQIAERLEANIREIAIDASIPVYHHGVRTGCVTFFVRANADQGARNRHGLAADVWVQDDSENLHSVPDADVPAILDVIAKEAEGAWRDILAASKAAA